jgi:hypothetical protein
MNVSDPIHKPERRYTPLYAGNLRLAGTSDIVLGGYGGAGQSIIANMLLELGFNYVDPYTEVLHPDGSTSAVDEHTRFRSRMAAIHRRDGGKAGHVPPRPWPRFFKTHLPPEVFDGSQLGGAWLIVRDPRDALYSWYNWRRSFAEAEWDKVDGDLATFLGSADYTGRTPVDDWVYFHQEWLRADPSWQPLVWTRFEDLKRDAVPYVREALRTFHIDVSDDTLDSALKRSSFESMRKHEESVADTDRTGSAEPRMMRRGKVGEWQEWLTPALSEYFARQNVRDIAQIFGYSV